MNNVIIFWYLKISNTDINDRSQLFITVKSHFPSSYLGQSSSLCWFESMHLQHQTWSPSSQSLLCVRCPESQRGFIQEPKKPFNLFFFNLIFIVFFFPLPFSTLLPHSTEQSPHCCPCPRVLFPFCLIPRPPNLPSPNSCRLFSIYESVSVLLFSSVCSLASAYEWKHMVLSFSDWLISLV